MIKVEANTVYTADQARSGSSDKGDWELVVIKDANGHQNLTMFLNAPQKLQVGDQFMVKQITAVKVGYRKDSHGQWQPTTTLEVDVEKIASEFSDIDAGSPWDSIGDDELPL